MTLMAIDVTQSQAHKGSFLQGGKVSHVSHPLNANRNSPPLSKQHQHNCNNNNNSRSSSDSSDGSRSSRSSSSSRYKTELCRPFEESGVCKYGDKCQFAHGPKELRTLVRHPKYKTELCRTFHSTGLCPYGPRCHFIHNSEQTRKSLLTSLTRSPTEAKSFNDMYVFNKCDFLEDKVFYDKEVDNYSFQSGGPVLELSDLVPPPSPLQREVGFSSMLLPIFNTFQKRAIV